MIRTAAAGAMVLVTLAACSSEEVNSTPPTPIASPRSTSTTVTVPKVSNASSTTTTTTTLPAPVSVLTPGDYSEADLEIHVGFRSEVSDMTSEEFAAAAMAILTDPTGWSRAGFAFVKDEASELIVVLAEGSRVDELCLPLQTYGTVNCQNGPVVALNADRWRYAWDGWYASVEEYRHYLVTHEVGHLIGLRHPASICPSGQSAAAVMDPQTRTTLTCPINGVPLSWEIVWALSRPAVIAPTPDWDGPKPTWPAGS